MVWFQAHHNNSLLGALPIAPAWQQGEVVEVAPGRLMIDVPLSNAHLFKHKMPNPGTGQIDSTSLENGTTRLCLIKFGDQHYVPFLFHAIGSRAYIDQHGLNASATLKPQIIPANYSGILMFTRLNGDLFFGMYAETGTITKFLLPPVSNDSTVNERCCIDWHITLPGVTVTAHVEEGGGYGGGGTFTFHGGAGGPYFGSGNSYPVPELYEPGSNGGTTPPVCPDGSMMGPNGCPEDNNYNPPVNCTKIVDPMEETPADCNYSGICYPDENCHIKGQVQFSDSSPFWENWGVRITTSNASGIITNLQGLNLLTSTVTFSWSVSWLDNLPGGPYANYSATEEWVFFFENNCCNQ